MLGEFMWPSAGAPETIESEIDEIADEFRATVPGAALSKALRHFWNQQPPTSVSTDA